MKKGKTVKGRAPTPPPGYRAKLNENGEYEFEEVYDYMKDFFGAKSEAVSLQLADYCFFDQFWKLLTEHLLEKEVGKKVGPFACKYIANISIGNVQKSIIHKDQDTVDYSYQEESEEPAPPSDEVLRSGSVMP